MYTVVKTDIDGCIEIKINPFIDYRGKTIKPYHSSSFEKIGINDFFKEELVVKSSKGVLRGFHFQRQPFAQSKLIYCLNGSIFDVAIDLRPESATFGKYISVVVNAQINNMVYIPEGFAHGYLVLEENTIVVYKMSSEYKPEYESGIRWDTVGVEWPFSPSVFSEKDLKMDDFKIITSNIKERP